MSAKLLETIFYVDDEDDIREVALMALEDVGGLKVQSFRSAREMLAGLPISAPDLLLLDVMMPDMDGPTLLAELRKRQEYAGVPAIFMTAKVQPAEISALIACGAIAVVAKPFDPMNLADSIRDIFEDKA